jgi:S-adenosylmethionine:diacylglycerol 3-amino-3-carboxypropyl transferase
MTVDVRIEPQLTEGTAWRAGRLNTVQSKNRLLFGRVYEDDAVERAWFPKGGRVFCIASAGCTALALSRDHDVVACDINPAQIEYVKRRLRGGALEMGAADKVMSFLRGLMPLAGWTRNKVGRFLNMDDPAAQTAFFLDELATWRFRYGLDLLLSPMSLRGAYAPALLACLPPHFGAVLRGRLQHCFARHPNRTNPYAHLLLSGFPGEAEGDRGVPSRAARIELVLDDAATYLERSPRGHFSAISLSNILDGASSVYEERLRSAVRHAAARGAIVVRRSFSEPPPELRSNRAEDDRSMIWGVVDVRAVEEL